jgi:predicted acyl esterase
MLSALIVALALAPAAYADNTFTATNAYIPTSDPTITLHADVLRPKGLPADAKTGVILSIGPYFNHAHQTATDYDPTHNSVSTRFDDLINDGRIFERGYTLVYVDLPGFGASTGCNDFGGPNEQLATKTAIEWAAAQSWSNGNVGMWGKSYDGWTQVMAMAQHPTGLAAAVIQSPIIDGYRTLYMNGVHYNTSWYATPGLYQAIDAAPPPVNDDPEYIAHWALGENPACYAANIAEQTGFVDKDDPAGFWAARDIVAEASKDDAAVLWSHGFQDANTKPDNFVDVWKNLQGPHRAWFGQYDHQRANDVKQAGKAGFMDEAMRWFAHYLQGDENAGDASDPPVEVSDQDGRWRAEDQWPPADSASHTMPLRNGTFTDDDKNSATSYSGAGVWSFSQPVSQDARIAGVPKLTLDAATDSPRATLVGLLYDVDASGVARLISRGAYAVKGNTHVAFELYPQDWRLAAGHRLGMLVVGSDETWWTPPHSQRDVTESNASLSVPLLANPRTSTIVIGKAPAIAKIPRITIPAAVIAANTVQADLP